MTEETVQNGPSAKALGTCLIRALSYVDDNPRYRSADHLAARMLPPHYASLLNDRARVETFKRKYAAGYEYVIGRTKLIDLVLGQSAARAEQLVIIGAGYDTRAIRFEKELAGATVFEIDKPATQRLKRERLRSGDIIVPKNLVFISLDLARESLAEALEVNGFRAGARTLWILEGLTMYLEERSVRELLGLIGRYSGPESQVVFDYICASARQTAQTDRVNVADKDADGGETFRFALEEGRVGDLLRNAGLEFVEEYDVPALRIHFLESVGGSRSYSHTRIAVARTR